MSSLYDSFQMSEFRKNSWHLDIDCFNIYKTTDYKADLWMAVSYDSDVNIYRWGTFPLSYKVWGYLQVITKSMAERECKLSEWKKS